MTTTTPKQTTIDALAKIRAQFTSFKAQRLSANAQFEMGFKLCAVELLRYIEAAHPASAASSEMWTSGCTEAELNERSSLGDHLAVTRKALGLLP